MQNAATVAITYGNLNFMIRNKELKLYSIFYSKTFIPYKNELKYISNRMAINMIKSAFVYTLIDQIIIFKTLIFLLHSILYYIDVMH